MQETDAMDFYQRIVEGKKKERHIDLEHGDGYVLSDVQMHPIDKKTLAGVIERLPEEMFDAAEDVDGDVEDVDDMEEVDGDMSAINEETVKAFEDLLKESLNHQKLTTTQVHQLVEAMSFEMLFEIGSEVINMSVEETGEIQDFHEPE
jgi:hypothetical protein